MNVTEWAKYKQALRDGVLSEAELKAPGRLIGLILVETLTRETCTTGKFASVGRLAMLSALSVRSVKEQIKALRTLGLIEIVSRGGLHGTEPMASVYQFPKVQEVHFGTPQGAGGALWDGPKVQEVHVPKVHVPKVQEVHPYQVLKEDHKNTGGSVPKNKAHQTGSDLFGKGGDQGAHSAHGKANVVDEVFSEFWRIIPKRKGDARKPARIAFVKAAKAGATPETIIAGAKAYAAHVERERTDPQYIKGVAAWLNAAGWDADYSPAIAAPKCRSAI